MCLVDEFRFLIEFFIVKRGKLSILCIFKKSISKIYEIIRIILY